jgi:hypothetical protein
MADGDLMDGLVSTYRTLNLTVRPLPEEKLRGTGSGGGSVRDEVRRLRDDELRFSQAFKVRVTTGQAMPSVSDEEMGIIGTEGADDTTAELIAQFGTARESTLAMLRGLPESEWDTNGSGAGSIRSIISDHLASDKKHLSSISSLLGAG